MIGPLLQSFVYITLLIFQCSAEIDLAADPPIYGVDCSTAIHYGINKKECPYFYDQYQRVMAGCTKIYAKNVCDQDVEYRMKMNVAQPPEQHNYTTVGFKHMKTPKELFDLIKQFYEQNKDRKVLEKWYKGSTVVNSWDSPTYMVSFDKFGLRGVANIKEKVWELTNPIIQEWTQHKLEPTSLYGVRIYSGGAVLATHVDRLPLVASCIINVDQDLEEPWPLEVYDHSGRAYNVTMEPGDMVLYESSTVLHGRPFPLKGKYYANVFVHFQPVDHELLNQRDHEMHGRQEMQQELLAETHDGNEEEEQEEEEEAEAEDEQHEEHDKHEEHEEPLKVPRRHGEHLRSRRLGRNARPKESEQDYSQTKDDGEVLRLAAAFGDLSKISELLANHGVHHGKNKESLKELLSSQDSNGWQALHEAVRHGSTNIVKYLVFIGADVHAKTSTGHTPLDIAKSQLGLDHAITKYLTIATQETK